MSPAASAGRAAGLMPPSRPAAPLSVIRRGVGRAALLLARTRGKSALPEALRLAHLIARAIATGESRGRA